MTQPFQATPIPTRLDVIIVEDEPVSRRALQSLVASEGFATRSFATAEEALSAVAAGAVPDVVLVDFNLPGMDGIEFIRLVERANATVMPVLITAAGPDALDAIRAARSVTCLPKPLDFGRLVALLQARTTVN